jgi:hypothetical protein
MDTKFIQKHAGRTVEIAAAEEQAWKNYDAALDRIYYDGRTLAQPLTTEEHTELKLLREKYDKASKAYVAALKREAEQEAAEWRSYQAEITALRHGG